MDHWMKTIAGLLVTAWFLMVGASSAFAQNSPTVSIAFSQPSIELNTSTTLTFTLTNPNGVELDGISISDTLPAGLIISNPDSLSSGCDPGVVSVSANAISLSGGILAGGGSCTFSINVLAIAAGTQTDTTGTISSTNGGTGGTATASLAVTVMQPTITQAFGNASIPAGGSTTLSFTITNLNAMAILDGVQFTDPFPAGLVVASPNGLNNTCGGTITATPGSSTVSLQSGAINPGGQSCTVSLNVTARLAGTLVNVTRPVSTKEGGTGPISNTTTLTVTVNGSAVALTASPNPSRLNQPVTFTATVTSGLGTPTGSVTFLDGTTALGTVALSSGVASFATSSLGQGVHRITAHYGGSGAFLASISSVLTQAVNVSQTSVALASSVNPSAFRQPVTFTATVTGSFGTPTGSVNFLDGAQVIGTVTLSSGVAAFTTTSLSLGSHAITASYAGSGAFLASSSSVLAETVNVPADSLKLRALEVAGTRIESQSSGQAISGSIGTAINEGLSGGGSPLTLSDNGVHLNLATGPAETDKRWRVWADARAIGWDTDVRTGDIHGGQVNALLGLSGALTPDLLLGAFAGYENFDYTSDLLDGRLKGDGWTVGTYLGWRFLPGVRFDAGIARSGVSYDSTAGTAAANFPGQRWIANAALFGSYQTIYGTELEPSLKVYSAWEHDDAFTDTLGVSETSRNFSNGRASGGAKLAYPWTVSDATTIAPYVGLYADYYFNSDGAGGPAAAALLLPNQFVEGWSARVTTGITVTSWGGVRLLLGGEVGGLGSDQFTAWTLRGHATVPF